MKFEICCNASIFTASITATLPLLCVFLPPSHFVQTNGGNYRHIKEDRLGNRQANITRHPPSGMVIGYLTDESIKRIPKRKLFLVEV